VEEEGGERGSRGAGERGKRIKGSKGIMKLRGREWFFGIQSSLHSGGKRLPKGDDGALGSCGENLAFAGLWFGRRAGHCLQLDG
jgi:hypothetical protein